MNDISKDTRFETLKEAVEVAIECSDQYISEKKYEAMKQRYWNALASLEAEHAELRATAERLLGVAERALRVAQLNRDENVSAIATHALDLLARTPEGSSDVSAVAAELDTTRRPPTPEGSEG